MGLCGMRYGFTVRDQLGPSSTELELDRAAQAVLPHTLRSSAATPPSGRFYAACEGVLHQAPMVLRSSSPHDIPLSDSLSPVAELLPYLLDRHQQEEVIVAGLIRRLAAERANSLAVTLHGAVHHPVECFRDRFLQSTLASLLG
jgi:hypothetical protein